MIRPATMRALDRWLGIPLCFLATIGRRLARARPASRARARPGRILFVELSEMGSAILAEPALRRAHEELDAVTYFLIFEHNRASLELTGTVPPERIFTLSTDGFSRFLRDVARFVRWCRRERIDAVVDLELFSRCTALLGWLSGAPMRAGFHRFAGEGLYRGDLLTHRVGYSPHRHVARNFLALVAALEAPERTGPALPVTLDDARLSVPRAHISETTRARVDDLLASKLPAAHHRRHGLVTIHPGCGAHLPQRRWPAAHFAEFTARLLASREEVAVALIGGPDDRALTAEIVEALADPRCIDLAGTLDLPDLPALFERAALLVCNDSGPAHFAATADLPSVVLFGPETAALYRPLGERVVTLSAGLACSPCVNAFNHRVTPCRDNACMRAIEVTTVLDAALRLLDGTPRLTVLPTAARS